MFKFASVFAGSYLWHTLGITIGYHRLLAHRAFTCNKALEYFFVAPAYLAFEGAPIWWATIHRAHHKNVDTPLDPHSPKFGLAHAWWGWVFDRHYPEHIDPEVQAKDLTKDPVYQFLEQDGDWWRAHTLNATINILFRVIILQRFGFAAAAASMLAGLTVMQVPVMLNVFCHMSKLGYRNFKTDDDSVNVWWVALLAMGEGWHNNHHALPGSAQSGLKSTEFDLSWIIIRTLYKLGFITRVNVPKESIISELEEEEEEGLIWQTA
jgi:fatty-acid desaturase